MLNKNQVNHLPKILKWYQLAVLILIALILSGLFSMMPQGNFWGVFWVLMIFPMLPIYIFALLQNNAVSFVFDDDKITINRGIVAKSNKILPFDKVQNVHVKTGALMSMFGLAQISIWTASQSQIGSQGTKPDGRIKLEKEDAKLLAETILNKKKP